MKARTYPMAAMLAFFCLCLFLGGHAFAEKKMPDTVVLELKGAKQAPVTFSHISHVQKAKINCTVCHHKDKDPKEARTCGTCHQVGESKDGAPPARQAFHAKCVTCHKESTAKGVSAPTKCAECHKK